MTSLLRSKWTTLCMLLLIGAAVVFVLNRRPQSVAVQREADRLDEKIADLQEQYDEFQDQKAYLQSEAYLEQQARLKLNYKKPDEHVVFVYHSVGGTAEGEQTLAKPAKNWQEWWSYLIGR